MEEHPVQQPIRAIDIDVIPGVEGCYVVGRNGVTRIEACRALRKRFEAGE